MGIDSMKWSNDCKYIAFKSDTFPQCLYVYYIPTLSLHTVIILISNISDYSWCDCDNILAILTNSNLLYIWKEDNMSVTSCFKLKNLEWKKNEKTLLLSSKSSFCIFNVDDIKEDVKTIENDFNE